MATKTDLRPVFERLKKIFAPYESKMNIGQNSDNMYLLNTRYFLKKNYPLMFGGVRLGKQYVSYYLMSIYTSPGAATAISPQLKKRMQGKSCFNFTTIDEPLFKELAKLTKAGAKRFSDERVVERLRQAQTSAARHRKQTRG
jgi:hypothetical protein